MMSRRSSVYRSVGTNGGGSVDNFGRPANGFPVMFRTIRNFDGSCLIMGFVRNTTGLYFLMAKEDKGDDLTVGRVEPEMKEISVQNAETKESEIADVELESDRVARMVTAGNRVEREWSTDRM